MNKLVNADGYLQNWFFKNYCQNAKDRLRILDDFKVELESYEDLPVGHSVYGAAVHGRPLWETIILFKVIDRKNKICYHPAFSEATGKIFARTADIKLPKKMTVLNDISSLALSKFHPANYSLLCLLEWSRWLILMTRRSPVPMPYGFWTIYNILLKCPEADIDIDVISFVNDAINDFLEKSKYYLKCSNLQDYIEYMRISHRLLDFKNSDFSILRERLLCGNRKRIISF